MVEINVDKLENSMFPINWSWKNSSDIAARVDSCNSTKQVLYFSLLIRQKRHRSTDDKKGYQVTKKKQKMK